MPEFGRTNNLHFVNVKQSNRRWGETKAIGTKRLSQNKRRFKTRKRDIKDVAKQKFQKENIVHTMQNSSGKLSERES
jgi:hypothetical protein